MVYDADQVSVLDTNVSGSLGVVSGTRGGVRLLSVGTDSVDSRVLD